MVTPSGSSLRTPALDEDYRTALISTVNRTLQERWAAGRRLRLKKGVRRLFELLLAHADFAEGGRIALSTEAVARGVGLHERWLTPILDECQEAGLVSVRRGAVYGSGCNGAPLPLGQLECEFGPILRALGGKAPPLPLPPRKGRPATGRKPYATRSSPTLVRMPPEYLDSLRQMAAANKTSLGGAIVVLLDQHRQSREPLSQPIAR
jgi:hypothetical protein